jgi:hypothetical protein
MNRILILLLIVLPFICTGDVSRAENNVCISTNITDLAKEKDCIIPVGSQFVLNYNLVDQYGHPVDCDNPECYICQHKSAHEYIEGHKLDGIHAEIKRIFIDVYTLDGQFGDSGQIKNVCSRFKNYVTTGYTCKIGKIYRGSPRLVVRISN